MALGPAGPLDHLPGGLTPRCESHGRGPVRPPPRPLLLPPRRSRRCQYRPTASAQSLWELLSYDLGPPLGDTPPVPAKLDALGDAAKLQFADSVARYSHADWERQQQAELTCRAARCYITIGRPPALTADFLSCYPSHNQPPFTAGCGLVRRSVSSPGTTGGVFWHRATLEPHARSGSAATATRCCPREPAFGTRATMACDGLKTKNQCEYD